MKKHLELLGWSVRDRVSGFTGVVTHVGLDLYGCVMAIVTPPIVTAENGEQKKTDGLWHDVARLEKQGTAPVMQPIPMKGDSIVAGPDSYKPTK